MPAKTAALTIQVEPNSSDSVVTPRVSTSRKPAPTRKSRGSKSAPTARAPKTRRADTKAMTSTVASTPRYPHGKTPGRM
jgi:hypothetical protein